MGVRRAVSLILAALIVINLPIIIYLTISTSIVFEKSFYVNEFKSTGVYDLIGDRELPNTISSQIITYFGEKTTEPPQFYLFTENENSHLRDVKLLIDNLKKVLYTSAVILLVSLLLLLLFNRTYIYKRFGKLLLFGGILGLAIGLIAFIATHNFGPAFTSFHYLFFPQGNWAFPPDSFLINLFPEQLFYDFFTAIMIRSAIASALLAAIGWIIMSRRKEYKIQSQ
jgi:integral membrane protein (TIGR01906 family)